VYLGLGLRLGSGTFAQGYDADALAYFNTASITDAAAKTQLNSFVVGLKSLNLWNSVVCWTLRSSQNKGSGSTAYSLGGLGTYNGTLTNGPTWGTNGISFTNSIHEITLPDNSNLYNLRTGFVVYSPSDTSANQRLIEFQDNVSGAGWYCLFRFYGGGTGEYGIKYYTTRSSVPSGNTPNTDTVNLGLYRSSAFTANNTSDNVFRDGSLLTNGARTGLPTINPAGSRPARQLFSQTSNMIGSFGLISPSTLTNSDISSIHSLYKTTLGTGLGLP
jgi:hypothetical protein